MAKRKIVMFVLVAAMSLLSNVHVYANLEDIPLEVGYDDPSYDQGEPHKNPVTVPQVSIDGYTLYFMSPCDGCLLRIVDENDNVTYSAVIPLGATSLVLPSYLSGNYELQIVSGIYCFYGNISL